VLWVAERQDMLELESFYSITTFIRAITSLLQIRQVARLRSTTCNQHGLSPTQKEHTNNPVQKPNCRGHAAGDVEVTRACGEGPRPSKDDSKESLDDACHPPQARGTTVLTPSQEGETFRWKHPRARIDELQRAGLKTVQTTWDVMKMTWGG